VPRTNLTNGLGHVHERAKAGKEQVRRSRSDRFRVYEIGSSVDGRGACAGLLGSHVRLAAGSGRVAWMLPGSLLQ
jgi:hypothetical protein